MPQIERLLPIRELSQALRKQLRAVIHKALIVYQRAHRVEIRESLSVLVYCLVY